jgi:hypothetical protein
VWVKVDRSNGGTEAAKMKYLKCIKISTTPEISNEEKYE